MSKEKEIVLEDGSTLYEDEDWGDYNHSRLEVNRYYRMMPELFEQIQSFHSAMDNILGSIFELEQIVGKMSQITGPGDSPLYKEYYAVYSKLFDAHEEAESKLNRTCLHVIKGQ